MKKGDKYALINWYGPEFHAAVEDNFSMGVMTSWVAIPIIGSAKYSFQIAENTNGAIGLLAGTGSWAAIDGLAGLLYGSLTFGNSRNNLTLSAGYGGFSYEGEGSGSALFSIAGAARLSDKVALVGDSFIFDADGSLAAIIIPGLRFYRTNKGAFQFGFAGMVVEGETFPVPFPFISWFIKI